MGRKNSSEAAIAGHSIVLLQERFVQLERIRERREERQLLALLSGPKQIVSSKGNINQQSGANFYLSQEVVLPSRLHFQDHLSLGLNLNGKHTDYRGIRTQPLLFADARSVKTPNKFDISDVDTSLHL